MVIRRKRRDVENGLPSYKWSSSSEGVGKKGSRGSPSKIKYMVLGFITFLSIYKIVTEAFKGTDGAFFWIYNQFGSLDHYQKTGKQFQNISDVLSGAVVGSMILTANGFNTDKASRHNYSLYYDISMQPYFSQDISLMEVGVRKGGSLKLWRELYSDDSKIWGIDIAEFVPQFPRDANIKVLVGSSTDKTDRALLAKTLNGIKFDIVVDDGDHNDWSQYLTFSLLGSHLKSTGVYIIEDNFVSHGNNWYYTRCGFDVSVHTDISGELVTFLYPPNSIAKKTSLGRIGSVYKGENVSTATFETKEHWEKCLYVR